MREGALRQEPASIILRYLPGICTLAAMAVLGWCALTIATQGTGVLGVNNHVPWGWDIVLFVFWIGLGHAGTLISAILLLTRKSWRRGIARQAEIMTLCALITAAVFPLIHVGRAWMIWQMVPIPTPSGIWPDTASALLWDTAAISSYLLLSVLFLYMGIRGEHPAHTHHRPIWAHSCLLMAGLLTPLVITVHSVVGCDFALTLRWQSIIIPPYFVCGAILSGLAAIILIALCSGCKIGLIGKLSQLTAGFCGAIGLFYAYELITHPQLRSTTYTCMVLLNVVLPLLIFSRRRWRHHKIAVCIAGISIIIGMWVERTEIIIGRSLTLTGGTYHPSPIDISMLLASTALFIGLFLCLKTRIPEEKTDIRRHLVTPSPTSPRHAALLGGGLFLLLGMVWVYYTQSADTAGSAGSSANSILHSIPALFVLLLLGSGIGVFLNYLRLTRTP